MTNEQALAVLEQMAARALASRDDHAAAIEAIQTLQKATIKGELDDPAVT